MVKVAGRMKIKVGERDILGYGGLLLFAVSASVLLNCFWAAGLIVGGVCIMRAVMKA